MPPMSMRPSLSYASLFILRYFPERLISCFMFSPSTVRPRSPKKTKRTMTDFAEPAPMADAGDPAKDLIGAPSMGDVSSVPCPPPSGTGGTSMLPLFNSSRG